MISVREKILTGALVLVPLIAAALMLVQRPIASTELLELLGVGLMVGMSAWWPILMPTSGARITLGVGLVLHAFWSHGLVAGFVVVALANTVQYVHAVLKRRHWDIMVPVVRFGSAIVTGVIVHFMGTGLVSLVFAAVGYWLGACVIWGAYADRCTRRGWWQETQSASIETVLFVPAFILIALVMAFLEGVHVLLGFPVLLVVLALQLWLGPAYSAFNQDRIVAGILARANDRVSIGPGSYELVLNNVYVLARALRLSQEDVRRVGYAALLQDIAVTSHRPTELWYPGPLTNDQIDLIAGHVDAAVELVRQVPPLTGVDEIIRFHHAAYNGTGWPAAYGDQIPFLAQVLAAANALVAMKLNHPESLNGAAHSLAWLREHGAATFHPDVLAAIKGLIERGHTGDSPAPLVSDVVEGLRSLVADRSRSAEASFWQRLTHRFRLPQERASLPTEVRAVANLGHILGASTSASEASAFVVEAVGELLRAKVWLALTDPSGGQMNVVASHGYKRFSPIGQRITATGGSLWRTLTENKPAQFPDASLMHGPLAQRLVQEEGVQSLLFVPLVAKGRRVGLLSVGTSSYHWFTELEVGLVSLVAGQAALALDNLRLLSEAAERMEHLARVHDFNSTLIDSLTTAIVVLDTESRVTLVNAAARNLMIRAEGVTLAAGSPMPTQLHPLCPPDILSSGKQAEIRNAEWHGLTLEVNITPLKDRHGQMLGVVWLARDVTAVRRMEEQVHRAQKLAAMGELSAGAAHEIRNPLTSIRGFIQLSQLHANSDDLEYFQLVLKEIDRIDGIIRDMLLLARPAEPTKAPINLDQLFHEVVVLRQVDLTRQGVQVVYRNDCNVTAWGDANLLRQVLLNLLINAVEAMPYGGTLTFEAHSTQTEVRFAIEDSGVGISPELLPKLFVPFFTTKDTGTGLGLALCYGIIQAHGGRIEVASRVGQGTTFTIYLPQVSAGA